jgi:hypothetical protein
MLSMRNNMIHYVQLIDAYAPCVVSSRAWNNEANMGAYCGPNAIMFERKVLSISDEAFLLVVLINYAARWQAEYANDIKKVRDKYNIYCLELNESIGTILTRSTLLLQSIGTLTNDDERNLPVCTCGLVFAT